MNKNILIALFAVAALPVFAKDLKCKAADESNLNERSIAVTQLSGPEIGKTVVTNYGKYKISVEHQLGDDSDSQTYIAMSANDILSQVYNVSEKSLYHLHAKNLYLQCWFE